MKKLKIFSKTLSQSEILNYLHEEKDSKRRLLIFNYVLKNFYKSPDENTFEVFCECMRIFDKREIDWYELIELKKVNQTYLSRFIIELLKWIIRNNDRGRLDYGLEICYENGIEISQEVLDFVESVFEQRNLFGSPRFQWFVCENYLMSSKLNFKNLLEIVVNRIKYFYDEEINNKELKFKPSAESIIVSFIDCVLFDGMKMDEDKEELTFNTLKDLYYNLYPEEERIKNTILYSLFELSKEVDNKEVDNNQIDNKEVDNKEVDNKEVDNNQDDGCFDQAYEVLKRNLPGLVDKYGKFAIPNIANIYSDKLKYWICFDEEPEIKMCNKLLTEKEEIFQIFSVSLFSNLTYKDKYTRNKDMKDLLIKFIKSDNPTVKFMARIYIENNDLKREIY